MFFVILSGVGGNVDEYLNNDYLGPRIGVCSHFYFSGRSSLGPDRLDVAIQATLLSSGQRHQLYLQIRWIKRPLRLTPILRREG